MALSIGSFFDAMYAQAVGTLSAKSGLFITDGQDLAGVLLLITLSWAVVTWVLTRDGAGALVEGFGIVARFSIVSILLGGWLSIVGGFFQLSTVDLAQRLTGTNSISESSNIILAGAGRLLVSDRASAECVDTPNTTVENTAEMATTCVNKPGTDTKSASWADLLVNFPMVLVTWLLRLVALLMMGLMLAAYLSVVFLAEIMFGLGITLGPVLVPWLIWRRTEWLFDGWLKFMVAASLTKVVAAFMVMAISGLIMGVKTYSEGAVVSSGNELMGVDEMAAFLLCVISAMGAFLMWQVPQLASALISGGNFSASGFGKGSLGSKPARMAEKSKLGEEKKEKS